MNPERKPEFEPRHPNGSIEVISGCMFSGKTDELIKRVKLVNRALGTRVDNELLSRDVAIEAVKVFGPMKDTRYGQGVLRSHAGAEIDAIVVDEENPREIFNHITQNTIVVAIDEVQFFNKEIVGVCEELAGREVRVIAAGLDTNFRGEPFGPMGELIAVSDKNEKQRAICMKCGVHKAIRTQRIFVEEDESGRQIRKPADYSDEEVVIGASEMYEARCRHCHELPGKPKKEFDV